MEIYKVTNKLNGKCYIGKTIYNLEERKKEKRRIRQICLPSLGSILFRLVYVGVVQLVSALG